MKCADAARIDGGKGMVQSSPHTERTKQLLNRALLSFISSLIVLGQSAVSAQPGGGDFRNQEIAYTNRAVTLAAELSLPAGHGPFPVVIWVHGSGTSPRSNPVAQAYAAEFLERGIAFLNPDKRGSGKSGGDWTTATFDDLASDAIAAVRFVQELPSIDQTRITLLGFSQGSHIVSLAGSDPAVNRVISMSGSVVPIHEQIRDEVRIMALKEGLTEGQVELVDSLNSLAFSYASSLRDGHTAGDNPVENRNTAWMNYAGFRDQLSRAAFGTGETVSGFPVDSNDAKFRFLSHVGSFDPLDHWPKLDKPMLFVYGADDENVDVVKSIPRLEDRLGQSDSDFIVLLFGRHGHAFIREDQMDFIRRWIVTDE